MVLKLFSRNKRQSSRLADSTGPEIIFAPPAKPPKREVVIDFQPAPMMPREDDPLRRLLVQKRYQFLLREQARFRESSNIKDAIDLAVRQLEERLAFVPAGTAVFPLSLMDQPGGPEAESDVEPFLLSVCAVTNAEYQQFVDDGGYEALEYWPEDIWPHLIEFKDLTDCPGPAHWREGRHDVRLSQHPVVGVSWFEAQAYALWAGLRLPTEHEWHVAASWSIKSSANIHRRFPWGDAMDNARCNIWSSRIGRTVPVTDHANGASANGILQLVGHVWEWTAGEFAVMDESGNPILGEMIMQSVRGGAFDTYFETQATSQFRTGLVALARTHNVGFRCALDVDQASWISAE